MPKKGENTPVGVEKPGEKAEQEAPQNEFANVSQQFLDWQRQFLDEMKARELEAEERRKREREEDRRDLAQELKQASFEKYTIPKLSKSDKGKSLKRPTEMSESSSESSDSDTTSDDSDSEMDIGNIARCYGRVSEKFRLSLG